MSGLSAADKRALDRALAKEIDYKPSVSAFAKVFIVL